MTEKQSNPDAASATASKPDAGDTHAATTVLLLAEEDEHKAALLRLLHQHAGLEFPGCDRRATGDGARTYRLTLRASEMPPTDLLVLDSPVPGDGTGGKDPRSRLHAYLESNLRLISERADSFTAVIAIDRRWGSRDGPLRAALEYHKSMLAPSLAFKFVRLIAEHDRGRGGSDVGSLATNFAVDEGAAQPDPIPRLLARLRMMLPVSVGAISCRKSEDMVRAQKLVEAYYDVSIYMNVATHLAESADGAGHLARMTSSATAYCDLRIACESHPSHLVEPVRLELDALTSREPWLAALTGDGAASGSAAVDTRHVDGDAFDSYLARYFPYLSALSRMRIFFEGRQAYPIRTYVRVSDALARISSFYASRSRDEREKWRLMDQLCHAAELPCIPVADVGVASVRESDEALDRRGRQSVRPNPGPSTVPASCRAPVETRR